MRLGLAAIGLAAFVLMGAAPHAAHKPAVKSVDWTKTVIATDDGGFRMGNPKAKVALVEYGSLSCPHCKHFDESGVTPLISKYVKPGKVSYEFRNYLLNVFDIPSSLIARCNGPDNFFSLTRALYKDQYVWIGKIQESPQADLESLQNLPQEQVPQAVAKLAGLPEWAAAHGVSAEKTNQCLSDSAAVDRLVRITEEATTKYPDFPGTPTFVINGKMVPPFSVGADQVWPSLEKKLNEALRGK